MAKGSSSKFTSRSSSKSSSTRSTYRPNPMIPKAGYTKSGRRSYEKGGKI